MENVIEETQLAYLKRQITDRLKSFDSDAYYYGKQYKRARATTVVIGALITVLSGLKLPLAIRGHSTENVALAITTLILILGALSTVLAFFGSFFAPQDCWRLSQDTYNKMRSLEGQIEMEERSPTFADHKEALLDDFFAKYQAILEDQNRQWLEIRARK